MPFLDVADDRVAHRRAGRLLGIGGDVDELGALGQVLARQVRVVGEDRRAHDEDQVVALERVGHRRDAGRQYAAEVRMALREAKPAAAGGGDREDGQVLLLGELNGDVPGA